MATFSLNIHKRVEAGLIATGKFDGSHACLAAATSAGNVVIHSPHRQRDVTAVTEELGNRLSWSGEIAELQIGSQVTAICTGHLGEDERDTLFIGTVSHLLAYNVEDNSDVFYKEMPDGIRCITVGKLGWLPNNVVIIGGNCSINVLDSQGTEVFWAVMGDIVTSVAIFDFDGDGENELLAGTRDFEIRVQKEDSVVWEVKETAAITVLMGHPSRQFAYAVENGTIGVYEMGQRLWRVKSKHRVVSMRTFDINRDNILELITAWNSGKVDARSFATGDVIFKVQFPSGVAGIAEADYRRIGRPDLIVISLTGEIRGYGSGSAVDTSEPGEVLRELLAKKRALQMELRQRTASVSTMYHATKLAVTLATGRGAVRLGLASGPGLLVYCTVVFAEGVFDGETLVAHPNRPKGELEIELRPPKNDPIDIHVKVCVGPPDADLMQVFEMTRQLPRFCMYEIVAEPPEIPPELLDNGVTVEVIERPQRIALWLNQNLVLSEELEVTDEGPNPGCLKLWLQGMRDRKLHHFSAEISGKITLKTEDCMFAGDMIQSLAMYLGLRELASEAKFPAEEKRMMDALERVKGLKEVDARLQAEAAGGAAILKNIVIRLEDARILENVNDMRKRLTQLKNINGDLIREHEIRMNSHRELTANLRELNIGVQRAARLRVGKAAANAVARCRAAIQDENVKALVVAMRHG